MIVLVGGLLSTTEIGIFFIRRRLIFINYNSMRWETWEAAGGRFEKNPLSAHDHKHTDWKCLRKNFIGNFFVAGGMTDAAA
jgi:hypothetical protein